MDWIRPDLAIGNHLDARAVDADAVDAIVCLKPRCCDEDRTDIDVYAFPMIDGGGNPPAVLDDAVSTATELVEDGQRVLVHCHAGQSRSVCVLAGVLMRREGLGADAAIGVVGAQREIHVAPELRRLLIALSS